MHVVKDTEQAEEFVLDWVGNRDLLKIFEWGKCRNNFPLNANDEFSTMSSMVKVADLYACLKYCLFEREDILLNEETNFK